MIQIGDLTFDRNTAVVQRRLGGLYAVVVKLADDLSVMVPIDFSLTRQPMAALAESIRKLPVNCEAVIIDREAFLKRVHYAGEPD